MKFTCKLTLNKATCILYFCWSQKVW